MFATEEASFLDDRGDLVGDMVDPTLVARLDHSQDLSGERPEMFRVVAMELFDATFLDEIIVEFAEFGSDRQVLDRRQFPGFAILQRINVKFQVILKQTAERFQNPAIELGVILFVE